MSERGLVFDTNGREFAGMGRESRVRAIARKVVRDNLHWTGFELHPEDWDELLLAIDSRHAVGFRVEVGKSRPVILWPVFGKLASAEAAGDLEPGEVRVVDGGQW